ncbi:MAG: GNAT family N-acetyltransferase [Bacteroidales bacterium]|nr:GNAT family N-acetyltransferase [Bacteroidales bacterium]
MTDNEVAVIHILAVSPDKQGSGIGSEMIREAIRLDGLRFFGALDIDFLMTTIGISRKPTIFATERY